ncbi:MAG: McrC family protein [Syntrophobacterales bacterium]|nr:McrC family protein [Syntrophobacterales bacterium]
MSNVIQVFEHTTLPVRGSFTHDHFKRLVQYNERHGNRFFAVGFDRIHFRNYVGVIQVGNLTIEILPKADKGPDSSSQKKKWQGALIEMLRQSGFIRVASMSDARLRQQLARLIILNYNPDVCGGREDVLAILFDMNTLFEHFVYVQLKRAEMKQTFRRISFKAQVSRPFWSADNMQKAIRPDIIAQIDTGSNYERVVMDTKWKIPGDGKPGDADLQQMHAYNVQFGANRSFLLYPRVGNQANIQGRYFQGKALQPSFDHNCGMVFLELFDGHKLRGDLGKDIVAILTNAELL